MSELTADELSQLMTDLTRCLTYPELDRLHALYDEVCMQRLEIERLRQERNILDEQARKDVVAFTKELHEANTRLAQAEQRAARLREVADLLYQALTISISYMPDDSPNKVWVNKAMFAYGRMVNDEVAQ